MLELSHTDSHLQSLNSSLIGYHRVDVSSSPASLMNLCHTSLIPVDKEKALITLGDFEDKVKGLQCLHQFLWVQGFSAVQDSQQILLVGENFTCILRIDFILFLKCE